jgi:flavin reductase (DIM6/NTAB) family NADH-FMN oxidoreductase RutF
MKIDASLNLAPFSRFNIVAYHPVPVLFFGVTRKQGGGKKDTMVNVEQTREFVVSVVTEDIAEKMAITSADYPPEVNEFEVSGLTPVPGDLVKAPRVAESPLSMECRVTQILEFGTPDVESEMILGEILRIHMKDDLYRDGVVDSASFHTVARVGWGLYIPTRDVFQLQR